MAVQDALRVSRRAGGVAHRGGGGFVQRGPFEGVSACFQQVFVAQRRFGSGIGHPVAIRHGDEMAHLRGGAANRLCQRAETRIEEQDLVPRVACNPPDLLRVQPRIDRVQDRTGA
jgi:hypothetical protein